MYVFVLSLNTWFVVVWFRYLFISSMKEEEGFLLPAAVLDLMNLPSTGLGYSYIKSGSLRQIYPPLTVWFRWSKVLYWFCSI